MLPQSSQPTSGTTREENFAYFLWKTTEKFALQIIDKSSPYEPRHRTEAFAFLSHFAKMLGDMFGQFADTNTMVAKYQEYVNFEFTNLPDFRGVDTNKVLTLCDFFVRDRKRLYRDELYQCFSPKGPKNLPYKAAFLLFDSPLKMSDAIPNDLTYLTRDAEVLQKSVDPMLEQMAEEILAYLKHRNLI